MSALGRLVVELALSTAQFTAGTKTAEQDALRMAKGVQDAMDRAGRSAKDFLGGVVTGALGAVASYATVATVIHRVAGAIERLDATGKAAQRFGVPAEELEKMAYAGDLAGVSVDQVGDSMKKLSVFLVEATTGGKEQAAVLKALGIEAKGADGSLRSTTDVMGDVADLFADLPDGALKTALAVKLFGKAGADMVPLLNAGKKALQEAGDEAERFGLVSTDASRKAAEGFNDNLTRLGKVFDGVFTRLAVQALPTLQAVGEALIKVTDSFSNAGDEASRLGSNQSATKFLQEVIIGSVTAAEALVGVVQAIRAVAGSVEVVATDIATAWRIARASPAEIGEAIRSGTGPLAEALAARNKTVADANAAYAALWNNNGAALSQALRKQFEQANAGGGVDKAQADALKKQADASDAARKANERRLQAALAAAGADDKASKAAGQLAKATADFVGAIEHRLEVSAQELALGRKMNDEETALADLRDRIAKGTISLSDAERLRVEGLIRQTQENRDAARVATEYLGTLTAVANHSTKMLDAEYAAIDTLRQQVVAERERIDALNFSEEALRAREVSMLRATAAEKEMEAATQGGSYALREQAALLRQLADAREQSGLLSMARVTAEANGNAAREMAADWERTAEGVRTSLTDAFRRALESGEDRGKLFAQVLGNEVQARLATAFSSLLADAVLRLVGNAGSALAASGGGGTNWLQAAGSAGGGLNGISNAYSLYGSLAPAANYAAVYSGQAYGTGFATQQSSMLAAQEAGMVSQAGGATASGWGAAAGWIAAAVLAAMQGSSDYSAGFRREQARDSGTALGDASYRTADLFSRLGVSDRIADLISGATLTARLFGRAAPRVEGSGIQGSIGGGAFAGNTYADIVEKGGLFRSDKRYQELAAVPEALDRFLDDASANLMSKAKGYGEALGLPVAALGDVSTQIKVALGDDAAANEKAIVDVLSKYGEALVAGYAEAVKPLALYGETTVQTIERVGAAIATVNQALDALGVTALQSSIAGGQAAAALVEMFGGIDGFAQSTSRYYDQFFSDAERTDRLRAQLTESFAEYGAVLPRSREAFRDLVEAQDLTTASGRDAFHALITVSGAFNDLITAEEALGEATIAVTDSLGGLTEKLLAGLDSVIADFVGGQELAQYRGARIQQTLAGGGITASVDSIIGASREDIAELWRAVGEEGKAAILEAYGAWQVLQDGIDQSAIADFVGKLATSADDLMSAYTEINPAAETLVDTWRRTTSEMQTLGDALAKFDGTQAVSAIDAFWQLVEKRDQLRGVVDSNADRAFNLQVGQGGQQAVNLLRQREADLWRQFASTSSPAIASAITDITLQRIQLEGSLHEQANRTQIDALKEQIAAAEKLRDTAAQMGQFVLSLQAGSLSNLGYQGRLSASEQIFNASLASGNDVQGSAQAYLQNAQGIYGGASAQYSAIFDRVTAELSALGERVGTDPTLVNAQSQLDALLKIGDTSAAQIEAIEVLNERFGEGLETLNSTVLEQVKQARELYTATQELVKLQTASITQAGQAYTALIANTGQAAAAATQTLQQLEREWTKP